MWRAGRGLRAVVVVCALLGWAGEARAQGFAPEHKAVWAKVGLIHSWATDQFAGKDEQFYRADTVLGERRPFRARNGQVVGGQQNTQQLTLDVTWAPLDGAVVGLYAPMLMRVYYHNDVNNYTTTSIGPGEPTLYAGYQLTPRGQWAFGSTLYVKGELPVQRKFPYTNEAIRSEGQLDLAIASASAIRLVDQLYLNVVAEYRWRLPYEGSGVSADPGDEVHVTAGLGGAPVQGLWLSASYAGMWGGAWEIDSGDLYVNGAGGQQLSSSRVWRRRSHAISVGAYVSGFERLTGIKGTALDVWMKVPVAGQDVAASAAVGVGVAYGFKP